MIIGGDKSNTIKNIKKNLKDKELNTKVEPDDPEFSDEERTKYLNNFFNIRKNKLSFYFKSLPAKTVIKKVTNDMSKYIEYANIDNVDKSIKSAIVTCNHFNPIDNIFIRKAIKDNYNKDIYIVIQDTNLALPDNLGYLMNYSNTIPLSKSPSYIKDTFKKELDSRFKNHKFVLIYPEEEMWFNYRLPRPCKKGAYHFAAEHNVPIISLFIEMRDLNEDDNEQFKQIKYIVHFLKTIYPDNNKSVRENASYMSELDYKQKCEAYEKIYNKEIEYKYNYKDIAGLKKDVN